MACNFYAGIAHGLNPIDGIHIKLTKGHPFGNNGIRDLDMGEFFVRDGYLYWEPRKGYEDIPLENFQNRI